MGGAAKGEGQAGGGGSGVLDPRAARAAAVSFDAAYVLGGDVDAEAFREGLLAPAAWAVQ